MIRISKYLPVFVAIACIFIGTSMEASGSRVGGPHIPLSFGIIKDILDAIFVFIFPWNGWIFLAPLLAALLVGWRAPLLIALWLMAAMLFGTLDTLVSFEVVTLARVLKGSALYLVIFGAVAAPVCSAHWCAKWFLEHRKSIQTHT